MKLDTQPVREMLAELSFVEQEIHDLLQSINHPSFPDDMWHLVANRILVKNDQKQQIYWLLEEEYLEGIDLNEILDREEIKGIQRK